MAVNAMRLFKSFKPFNRFAQFKPLPEVSVEPLGINGA